MSFNDMEKTDRGRFCGKCNKEVFDLTNCSIDEIRDLEQKHGPICGSIRMAKAATVAISLATAACQDKPENRPQVAGIICLPEPHQVENPKGNESSSEPEVMGRLMVPRENTLKNPDPSPTPPSE
jgi:hypothetical protein